MIHNKSELREYLSYEMKRYGIKGNINYLMKLFTGSERAVIWHFQKRLRITEYHINCGHKIRGFFSKVKLNKLSNKYCLHININNCEKGLKIMHLGPILMNGHVRCGENLSIHINTALAAHGVTDGIPVIGNNVVIGVGANIIGGINIADGIAIGANSLVNKSFLEENIAVAGVPAKKISNNGKSKWNKNSLRS